MSDDSDYSMTRRALLAAAGVAGAGTGVAALSSDNQGNLTGGTMALSEAYNVAENLWIGPASARSEVSAKSGRVYMASDSQVEYYGDNGSWNKMGVGSSQDPVPSINTEESHIKSEFGTVHNAPEYAASGSGTVDDPWIDAVNPALEACQEDWGAIYFPPGLYEQTETIDWLKGLGPYARAFGESSLEAVAPLIGSGMRRCQIRLADNADTNLIEAVQSDPLGTGKTDYRVAYWAIHNMHLNGVHENNTSGHIIYADEGSGFFSRLELQNVALRWAPERPLALGSSPTFNRSVWMNVDAKYGQAGGLQVPREAIVMGGNSLDNGGYGYELIGDYAYLAKPIAKNNDGQGIFVDAQNCEIKKAQLGDNCSASGNAEITLRYTSVNTLIDNAHVQSAANTSNAIGVGGQDNHIRQLTGANSGSITDNGDRTKYNGVIGGGPLGGKDIGSLTGASAGDVAMGNGTKGSADAWYVLKSTGDWQALHDPTVTITPA